MAIGPIKQRWFRFSLRTLLLAVAVLCIWVATKANAARKQREIVAAIIRSGGTVGFDYQYDSTRKYIDDAKPPGPEWVGKLFGTEWFTRIYSVVGTPGITDDTLQQLGGEDAMRHMILYGGDQVTDRGFRSVGDIPNLTEVRLIDGRNLTDAGLAKLHQLRHLENLRIINCPQVTDAGLEHLKRLSKLQLLIFDGDFQASKAGISELRESLPNCRIHLMWTPLVELNEN